MYILIALAILVLASFVVAYYASKTWHWSQVVLVEAIFLSAVGYMLLAVEVLGIHAILRSQINQYTQQLTETQQLNAALSDGTDDPQLISRLQTSEVQIAEGAEEIVSAGDLDHKLHMLTRIRGRMWGDVAPAGVDPQTGVAQATLPSADTTGINTNTIVFVFEQGEPAEPDPTKGAQYLGEFRVTKVEGQQIALAPVLEMDDFELQRLSGSRGPWAMYETMPVDRQEIFAGMSEEELRQKLPPQTVDEYVRDGKKAGPDDDQWRVVGYDEAGNRLGPEDMDKAVRVVYERRLREYALEFEELARQRIVMLADIAAVRQDNQRLAEALASAQRLQAFREDELQRLGVDRAGVTRDRQTMEQQLALVERQRDVARQRLADTLQANSRLASELAAKQAALARQIDQQSAVSEPPAPLPVDAVN